MTDIECEVCFDDHPDTPAACARHLTGSQRDLLGSCYALATDGATTAMDILLRYVDGPFRAPAADLIAVKKVLVARGVRSSDPEVNAALGVTS